MIFYLFSIFAIIILFIILSWVWPPDSPWAPWWSIKDKEIKAALKLAKVSKNDLIYDLGSGTGKFLIIAAREFGAGGVGIEIDPLRFLISKILIRVGGVSDKVRIIRGSFFEEDIKDATVIFAYLVPKTLNRLLPKFKKELRPGTRIISYRYEINRPLKKYDKEHNLRLYKL